jgi:alkaline phosphatase
MMVEGGKVDWASHANDAASVINDVIAINKALDVAVEFYNKHPNETLMIFTGDHETGGLTIGFAGTDYDTHLNILAKQKMSFIEYDKLVKKFRDEKTSFSDVLASIKTNFGLMAGDDKDAVTAHKQLILSDYESEQIKAAYDKSIAGERFKLSDEVEWLLYGSYEPLSVQISHILNQKAGVGWTSYAHTGLPVPVFAKGVGEDLFAGYYDNTKVFHILKALTGVS